jgi:chemotaxis protein methyltransferase CheR
MLQQAVSGIYKQEKIEDIPLVLKKKYFLRSKNREDRKVRVIANLRSKIDFLRINLLDLTPINQSNYQIIFCRNVLIYFDRPTQYKILKVLCSNLINGGYLFLGHSESITGLELPVKSLIPTVFIKI